MEPPPGPSFLLSSAAAAASSAPDPTPNFFKSSFARSMVFGASAAHPQSKSLDYVFLDEGATISEECEGLGGSLLTPSEDLPLPPDMEIAHQARAAGSPSPRKPSSQPRRSVPTLPTYDPAYPKDYAPSHRSRSRSNDALKFWKLKQQESVKTVDNNWAENDDVHIQEESKDEEILRLRKECQGLMESNRKLQRTSNLDASLLQSQVDTLQWQLKQAESNRQMYRAVMEQVSKFLERVHRVLETSNTTSSSKTLSRAKSRVPRSRSVHTVAAPQSRASSPSPCHPANVHRANSISQIQDSYSAFRDYAWRGNRQVVEESSPERLSQEAFRLMRTIQSLLGTREPDLARVSDTSQRRDSTSMGSCSSLVQSSCCTLRDSEESKVGGGPGTPQLSVGSAEDESGFSSMSSFHDVGVASSSGGSTSSGGPPSAPTPAQTTPAPSPLPGSPHELGLPLVDHPPRHRRWSSTPADTAFSEPLRVLWCRGSLQPSKPAFKMANMS